MSEILKPCPFCGSEARMLGTKERWFNPACSNAECGCEWTDSYATEAEAIAAWNTRTPIEYDDWFYLPKPKKEIVDYSDPEITRTENGYKVRQIAYIADEAIRGWGEELGDYIMKRICKVWNTRATHGTLTAEQVREAAKSNSRQYESPVDDGVWIREYDWQAIADELNDMLGSGTCELVETDSYSNANEVIHVLECSACGKTCEYVNGSYPRCPHCGKKVE